MTKIANLSFITLVVVLSSCQVIVTTPQVSIKPASSAPVVDLPSPTFSEFTQVTTEPDRIIPQTWSSTQIPRTEAPTESFYPPEIHEILPSGLTIDEYALVSAPSPEPLTYTAYRWTAGEMHIKHNPYRWDTFPDISFFDDMHYSMSTTFQGQKLVASEYFTGTTTSNSVALIQIYIDNKLVDNIPIGAGGGNPNNLQGLWTYDQNWVVEIAYISVSFDPESNNGNISVTGQIVKNGVLLNEQEHVDDMFGFQTMHGRPFYFYKQDGKINISYDDQLILLGYDSIPHYGCCSAADLNPRPAKNMVSFFAQKDGSWYYVEVGVYNQ